jgi:hypothetical protein
LPLFEGDILKLHFWCNAFIPGEIAGLTEPVTAGLFVGQTCVLSPLPLNGAFLTDNRSFRRETHAPSRLHARVVVDLERGRIRDWHRCGETIGIHRETGEELCRGRETTDRVLVRDFRIQSEPLLASFTLQASCSNPCLSLAPSVDMVLEVTVTALEGHWAGLLEVAVTGRVEPFPAFEMYVRRARSRRSFTLFRLPVDSGVSLLSMLGPANRSVEAHMNLPAMSF